MLRIAASPILRETLDGIGSGVFSADDRSRYKGLVETLTHHDYFMVCADFDAYWAAQMDLIEIHPHFNLYNSRWPIRTGVTHDPPAKFVFRDEVHARVGIATDSLVSHGSIISGGRIHRSVLSVGCRINSFSEVEESVLFENVRIGRHARLRRCIIDKDVEIPQGSEIGFDPETDRKRFHVTEGGIVVIPKRTKLEEV